MKKTEWNTAGPLLRETVRRELSHAAGKLAVAMDGLERVRRLVEDESFPTLESLVVAVGDGESFATLKATEEFLEKYGGLV